MEKTGDSYVCPNCGLSVKTKLIDDANLKQRTAGQAAVTKRRLSLSVGKASFIDDRALKTLQQLTHPVDPAAQLTVNSKRLIAVPYLAAAVLFLSEAMVLLARSETTVANVLIVSVFSLFMALLGFGQLATNLNLAGDKLTRRSVFLFYQSSVNLNKLSSVASYRSRYGDVLRLRDDDGNRISFQPSFYHKAEVSALFSHIAPYLLVDKAGPNQRTLSLLYRYIG